MSISAPFIHRPVGTTLLTIALGLAGAVAYNFLPVAPLPQVDFPAIRVGAGLPGASPETMASSVATPLERQFGRIAGLNEMTSSSTLGSTGITLQFDLTRNIDAAARDVQAGINAARGQFPANLPQNPTWRMQNPADPPVLQLGFTSDTMTTGEMYDAASTILQQRVSQIKGVGTSLRGRGIVSGGPRGRQSHAAEQFRAGPRGCPYGARQRQRESSQRKPLRRQPHLDLKYHRSAPESGAICAVDCLLQKWGAGGPVRYREGDRLGLRHSQHGLCERKAVRADVHFPAAAGKYHRHGGPGPGGDAPVESYASGVHACHHPQRPDHHDSRGRPRRAAGDEHLDDRW